MNIVIAGGSGFLGRPLTDALVGDGHTLVQLTRGATDQAAPVRRITWTPDGSAGSWSSALKGAGAVINLAGESIGSRRWTTAQKKRIVDSRLLATRSLVTAIGGAPTPPPLFLSGSAVGYYGQLDDRLVTEETPPGDDFLASVCVRWETEAMNASSRATRVVCLRTGLPLARDGGALAPMLPPFWFGAGGPVGSGRQFWSWIHRQDWIDLVRFTIANPSVVGPMNATGPQPVTNKEFAKALGRAMHRPAFMPAPALALKVLFGEMAQALILSGQRVVPAKAQRLGFTFRYNNLDDALASLFR
jgi:uncharacterized protein (TIGR01777 family)